MGWSGGYVGWTTKDHLSPQYIALWCENRSVLDSGYGAAATSIGFDTTVGDVAALLDDTLLIYDASGYELLKKTGDGVAGTYTVDRGQYGTLAKQWSSGATILRVFGVFATHDVTGFGHPLISKCAPPSGVTQDLTLAEGQNRMGLVSLEVQDEDDLVTRKFKGRNIVNTRFLILGGYDGLPMNQFSTLFSGVAQKVAPQSGVYTFHIGFDIDRMRNKAFGQIEDFAGDGTDTLTADINSSVTSLTLTSGVGVYTAATIEQDTGGGKYVSGYFALKDTSTDVVEYVRVPDVAHSPPTFSSLERGALSTTASAHTAAGTEVRYFMSWQDNPLTIALYLMLSQSPGGTVQSSYDLQFGDSSDTAIGARMFVGDIDVTGIEALRDRWFPDDVWIVNIRKRTNIFDFIRKHILKPLNCAFYITRSGKLSILYLQPPIPTAETIVELNETNVIGVPRLEFARDHIINNAVSKYDFDVVTDDFDDSVRVINATSQANYERDGEITLEPRGASSVYGGSGLATKYARKKVGHFGKPMAPVRVPVLFNTGALVEPGNIVYLNHSKIPDPDSGVVGFSRYMFVIGKNVDWRRGMVELTIYDPGYASGGRVGVLGPSDLPDYTSATDEQKSKYIWLSDSNGKMSDGSDGWVLY